uniref:Interphotoreceptor matrix proteoglycan 1 n=1 Tax=Oreochromis aureus TaxID=47969 RepID=A0A668UTC5_OREAU
MDVFSTSDSLQSKSDRRWCHCGPDALLKMPTLTKSSGFEPELRRSKRSVFLHSGVRICPQETISEVIASHQAYYQLRVCQEAVWEAFRIFFDRIPGTAEYQRWVHTCQHESLCISDLAKNFSGSEEHMSMIQRVRTRFFTSACKPCFMFISTNLSLFSSLVEQIVEFSIDLVDPGYRELLDDPDSPQYIDLAQHLQDQMQHVFDKLPGFRSIHVLGISVAAVAMRCSSEDNISSFRPGGISVHYSLVFEVSSPQITSEISENATDRPKSSSANSALREMVTKALREEASLPVDLDSINFEPGNISPQRSLIYMVTTQESEVPIVTESPEGDSAESEVESEQSEPAVVIIDEDLGGYVKKEGGSPTTPPDATEDMVEEAVQDLAVELDQTSVVATEPNELLEKGEEGSGFLSVQEEHRTIVTTATPPLRYLTTPTMTTASHGRELVVFFSLRVTNMDFSEDLFNKTSPEYRSLENTFLDLLPFLQANLTGFKKLEILNFRKGSVVVNSKMKFAKSVPYNITEAVHCILEEFCTAAAKKLHIQIDTHSLDIEPADQADPCKFQACGEFSRCVVNAWTKEAECQCQLGFVSVDGLPCQSLCVLQPNYCQGGECRIVPGYGAVCTAGKVSVQSFQSPGCRNVGIIISE